MLRAPKNLSIEKLLPIYREVRRHDDDILDGYPRCTQHV
jgi:hypothetical protein